MKRVLLAIGKHSNGCCDAEIGQCFSHRKKNDYWLSAQGWQHFRNFGICKLFVCCRVKSVPCIAKWHHRNYVVSGAIPKNDSIYSAFDELTYYSGTTYCPNELGGTVSLHKQNSQRTLMQIIPQSSWMVTSSMVACVHRRMRRDVPRKCHHWIRWITFFFSTLVVKKLPYTGETSEINHLWAFVQGYKFAKAAFWSGKSIPVIPWVYSSLSVTI